MQQPDQWKGVVDFVTVATEGSLTKAAQSLGISTSQVSRNLDRLEHRLGVSLLKRSTRRLSLTAEGSAYLKACAPLVQELASINQDLIEGTQKPRGLIRITAGGEYVTREVAPLLAEFMLLYPEITLTLDLSPRKVDLIAEGYDLAIRFGALEDSALVARKLTTRKLAVCASPAYLQARGIPQHPDDLSDFDCLPGNSDLWRFQVEGSLHQIRVQGRFRCGHPTALAAAATKGLGLIYVPRFYVKDLLQSGRLVTVLDDFVAQDKASWLVYPAHGYQPVRVRLLIDFLFRNLEALREAEQIVPR